MANLMQGLGGLLERFAPANPFTSALEKQMVPDAEKRQEIIGKMGLAGLTAGIGGGGIGEALQSGASTLGESAKSEGSENSPYLPELEKRKQMMRSQAYRGSY